MDNKDFETILDKKGGSFLLTHLVDMLNDDQKNDAMNEAWREGSRAEHCFLLCIESLDNDGGCFFLDELLNKYRAWVSYPLSLFVRRFDKLTLQERSDLLESLLKSGSGWRIVRDHLDKVLQTIEEMKVNNITWEDK